MGLVETETRGGAIWIWLNRPDRHNALVPALVSQLRSAIAEAATAEPVALVLSGRGSSFSTGGDIGGFGPCRIASYTQSLLGRACRQPARNDPRPAVLSGAGAGRGQWPGDGWFCWLDAGGRHGRHVRDGLCPALLQSGGLWAGWWLDSLAAGPHRHFEGTCDPVSQHAHQCFGGRGTGTCRLSGAGAELVATVDGWGVDLGKGFAQTHRTTRQSVWDARRCAMVRDRLDQEKARFLDLVSRQSTLDGMKEFTRKRA